MNPNVLSEFRSGLSTFVASRPYGVLHSEYCSSLLPLPVLIVA
jgi:hypothetical protein